MTDLAPHLSAFLRQHLPRVCNASRHTVASYADSFMLLVRFAAERLDIRPSEIAVEHLTPELILDFLDHLEQQRRNSVGTRNVRLAAIKSFFRYLEYRVAACLEQARQVHAIPLKRRDEPMVNHLDRDEVQALLDAPDPGTPTGLRDRAMLHVTAAARKVPSLASKRITPHTLRHACALHTLEASCQSRLLRANRDTSRAATAPTLPKQTCATMRSNPARLADPCPGFAGAGPAMFQKQPSHQDTRPPARSWRQTPPLRRVQRPAAIRRIEQNQLDGLRAGWVHDRLLDFGRETQSLPADHKPPRESLYRPHRRGPPGTTGPAMLGARSNRLAHAPVCEPSSKPAGRTSTRATQAEDRASCRAGDSGLRKRHLWQRLDLC